ncbi:MAG: hypothetical protein A2220_13860 [Ignavibacteria bacterium RIFOXYA2_FULL_35_10]|nr:MAG: hypothetical protein A2220_13860 [Ignavibacteria bacterium RIFOXYA2_FULL_35_10]
MIKSMRQSTLETLGLGNVIDIFKNGKLPVKADELVEQVFGKESERGALVISGANGIVGAGKMMQLGVRLQPYRIPLIGLDFPGVPDGIGFQYSGLAASFGKKQADEIMSSVIRYNYDGTKLPVLLKKFNPKLLIEAIPEILEVKKSHYKIFSESFPGIEIKSVTSGFPSSELGVDIYHPAFPHQINKIWEVVETKPSKVTQLFWALGMLPIPVSDHWAFVLDVLFCGLTLSALRYHEASNMPFWKIDKYVRKILGPNPFRAHDVIGARGANFLTWSCLHHLSKHYGKLFEPTASLVEHKDSGQNWYPLNHLRPIVNWTADENELNEFGTWILGSLIQMTSLMLHENRAHFTHINSIGELCAQFRSGVIAMIRRLGSSSSIKIVEEFHKLFPGASAKSWHPDVFKNLDKPEWQQLYVNAEHDGKVGVITIARESYNWDVNEELNRAIDWLKSEKIERVIVTGDFHLSTQLVGADTNEFFPALNDEKEGFRVSYEWSKTARRLHYEFKTSVGFISGKRCLGGMLELMIHCRYLVSVDDANLGAPEVTLPVVPGMEMCHWTFRKVKPENWILLLRLLLSGKSVKASESVGWLTDYAGSIENAIKIAYDIALNDEKVLPKRILNEEKLTGIPTDMAWLPHSDDAARKAILDCVINSCGVNLNEAITIQSKHSAAFMTSKQCQNGFIGDEYTKTMLV